MKITHKLRMHGECTVDHHFNYYLVIIETEKVFDIEALNREIEKLRGNRWFQEDMTAAVAGLLPPGCKLTITCDSHVLGGETTTEVQT